MTDRSLSAMLRDIRKRLTSVERRLSRSSSTSGGTSSSIPVGMMAPHAGAAVPAGWLLCDGSAISRTAYPALLAVIGGTYGTGNGSTTFNVPNLTGRVPVGHAPGDASFGALGQTGGAKTHTLGIAEVPKVSGGFGIHGGEGGSGLWAAHGAFASSASVPSYRAPASGSTPDAPSLSEVLFDNGGGGQPHNNLQPYLVVNYIIKAD